MMARILKYFFSVFVISLISCGMYSQTYRTKGLRLGMDISRFSLYYFDPGRVAYEFSGDYEIKRDLYLTGEYGMQTVNLAKPTYNYYSKGDYYRIGFDRNFLKYDNPDDYDMAYLGLCYGISNLKHSADSIKIPENYWGIVPDLYNFQESNYSAQWIELVAGLRTELFRNFFIGWSIRARFLVTHTKDQHMDPYNIPGYGSGQKKSTMGFNFSIYYRIPFYKKEVNYKPIKK
jgi:hypothetical protein